MRDGGTALLHRVKPTRAPETAAGRHRQKAWRCRGRLWLVVLVVAAALEGHPSHGEGARPIRIGALTDAWGATPHIMGLRDGLAELGYQPD